jgi:hypothetical protein
MKIELVKPKRKYPYLAIFSPNGEAVKEEDIRLPEVVLISKIYKDSKDQTYVQTVQGTRDGHFTTSEKDYYPLPSGFKVIIEQNYND